MLCVTGTLCNLKLQVCILYTMKLLFFRSTLSFFLWKDASLLNILLCKQKLGDSVILIWTSPLFLPSIIAEESAESNEEINEKEWN